MIKLVFNRLPALLLIAIIASLGLVEAQSNFNVFSGNTIVDPQIDGTIGSEWDDAGKYSNASINPKGTAEVWVKHDDAHFYVGVRLTPDSGNPWVALQFAGNSCMILNADGALFGHDEYSANGYQDIFFGGLGAITIDAKQDGIGVIKIESSNATIVELKKPLNSGDSAGKDIAWLTGETYTLVIMWDSNGGGSSGGSTSHREFIGVVSNPKTLYINPETIPEFSSISVAIFLVASTVVCVAILRKKRNTRRTAT